MVPVALAATGLVTAAVVGARGLRLREKESGGDDAQTALFDEEEALFGE